MPSARASDARSAARRCARYSRCMSRASQKRSIQARLRFIGAIESALTSLADAPMQGSEGAPDAWLIVEEWAAAALHGLAAGDEVVVITWLHEAHRRTLQVHPRSDPRNPLTG